MNEHILIIDDEQCFRFSVALALKRRGYRVSEADDGKDAYEQILAAQKNPDPFDMILMDMDLPSMPGVEILRLLHEKMIELPVLVVSGNITSDLYRILLDLGCPDIYFKPINEQKLVAKVTELLQRPVQGGTPAD